MLEELLNKYDLYHGGIINGSKVKFNINYLPLGNVYISLVGLINDEEKKYTIDTVDNDEFKNYYLPRIIEYFISRNPNVSVRKIMGKNDNGTFVIQREDLSDSLIIRNCNIKTMDLAETLYNSYIHISTSGFDSSMNFDEKNIQFDNYIKYNVIFDYARLKKILLDESNEIDKDKLFTLNIARYLYTIENAGLKESLERVKQMFDENENVVETCELFKSNDYNEDNIITRILSLAEFEKNNDNIIQNNRLIEDEALKACNQNVNCFDDSFINYWANLQKEAEESGNIPLSEICIGFIDSRDLFKDITYVTKENKNNKGKVIVASIKQISESKREYSSKVDSENTNNQENVNSHIENSSSLEEIKQYASEYAKKIVELEEEREALIESADEYARIILKNANEHESIVQAAEEQAKRLFELEQQNIELRRMAEEYARLLNERNNTNEKVEENNIFDDTPVKAQDISKITNLLFAISSVKDTDFAVNHPTVSQYLSDLEDKTISYLTLHKNVIPEEKIVVPIEKEEMTESKSVTELLTMIRNAYKSSHEFEKDGRHTLINLNPVDEDTYRVSLYSIKDDDEDLLMDAFFEQFQLTDKLLEELCDIYKENAIIVASKIDNVPPDLADFLAIDNMNNAIRFMNCKRELIDKINEYI